MHFFEKKIRPALREHCYECHSEEEGVRKGGLWLDRREGWAAGGDSGPALVPGDPGTSLLFHALQHEDPDLEMPPNGKLPDSVVNDFEEWIARGAPDPRDGAASKEDSAGMSLEEAREFWSFQPRKRNFGNKESIDDFVLARLEEAGLSPAPAASPEARLRRLKYDLTGLPPTVEEQDEFLTDPSVGKWEELVDRWLATEAFGERWGRHWLDIARYADTSGGGRALAMTEAWRFRDLVIEAFAEDRPLDQLVLTHLAGDLLPWDSYEERSRNLISTGFLVLGPHNYENQNKDELELEIVDEQLDTLGRAFLGMTIGCARCHDHKFDPVPARDYYAMAGVFLNADFVTHANVSQWHTEPIPPSAEVEEAMLRLEKEEAAVRRQVEKRKDRLAELGRGTGGKGRSVPIEALPGLVIDDREAEFVGEWTESTSLGRWVGESYRIDGNEGRGRKSAIFRATIENEGRYELRLGYAGADNRNSAVPVEIDTGAAKTTVAVDQKRAPEHDRLFQTLGVFELKAGARTVVTVSNDSDESGVVIADAVQWLLQESSEQAEEAVDSKESEADRLERELAEAEKELKRIRKEKPDVPEVMAVVDRKPELIGDTEIRIRGVESNRGEKVPRGVLRAALAGEDVPMPDDASGRLELARWVVDSGNPLTARVLANRIWLKLMGEGIVRSPDNFGVTGSLPTHPELLDYLANRLVASGWSTKALVREIVLSDVYSAAGENPDPRAPVEDAENKLLWRAHHRPLDVEAMRDSMLVLAGALDREGGGPSLPENFRSEFKHEFVTRRRSVYVPVFRNSGHEMFGVFDFANPNFTMGKRFRSTIPTQALFLTNGDLVHDLAAGASSAMLVEEAENDRARVVLAFRRTLGREPGPEELELAMRFLRARGDTAKTEEPDAWEALQRSLFASVDFRFLR